MPKASPRHNSALANPNGYWQRSQQPLQALFFLLPLIFLYELGTLLFASDPTQGAVYIYARSLLHHAFEWVGVTGYYLPGIIVVVVLLSLHLVRRDPWRIDPPLYALMWVESVLLAIPLFVFLSVLARQTPEPNMMLAQVVPQASWQAQIVFSIGAGIYEELLFRLIAIAFIHMIIVDVLALDKTVGAVAAVALSSIAFSLYHFSSWQEFHSAAFLIRTIAGVYLAGVYLLRGFGIVAATHAVYDVIWVAVTMLLVQK